MILPIHLYGDPVLRQKSRQVNPIDDGVLAFALDMIETMHDADGIGLAAVQVGRPIRLLVADIGDRAPRGTSKIYLNPVIIDSSGESTFDEGCLSVPGINADIVRPEQVVVRYVDGKRKEREDSFTGLLARVLQHEIDHLDGKLFIDYLSPVRRAMLMRKLKALSKETARKAPAL
jgi:peptide deformylase